MPMYEFTCEDCKKSFEELIFTANDESDVTCPSCHSGKVAKHLSAFAVGGSDSGYSGADFGGGGGCATGSCCSGGNCGF